MGSSPTWGSSCSSLIPLPTISGPTSDSLTRNDLLKNLAVTANVLYHHQILLQGTKASGPLRRKVASSLPGTLPTKARRFRNRQVAVLANIMRQVTNSLFASMDQIWSGRVEEPPCAAIGYGKLNRLLVALF